jgi:hypothetical protein
MHRTSKYLALTLGLIASAEILVFALRDSRRPKIGFNVPVASPRIVMLHISSSGGLAINSESVPNGQLAGRLRKIYGTGAEGFLYLFPENDTPAQRIADVIDVAQRLHSEKTRGLPVPGELQMAPENMNIQIRLVTSGALYSAVSARLTRWSQWVDATLSSNPPCIESKS